MVSVTAARDLVNVSTGLVVVPLGTAGVVTDVAGQPDARSYEVDFSPSSGTVTRWVMADEVIFADGELGPARAFYEGSGLVLTGISYAGDSADYEQKLGTGPIALASALDITFSDGSILRIESDRNSGQLNLDLR